MNRIVFVFGTLAFVCCKSVIAGPALESLTSAAGADAVGLSVIFDGAVPVSAAGVQLSFFLPGNTLAVNAPQGKPQYGAIPPVPEPAAGNEKEVYEDFSNPADVATLSRALPILLGTRNGWDLGRFYQTDKVEIEWAQLHNAGRSSDLGLACSPEACPGRSVIYLGSDYKDLFRDPNPTFLAITLAHELTHMQDYKYTKTNKARSGTAVELYAEVNAWSNEIYVYQS